MSLLQKMFGSGKKGEPTPQDAIQKLRETEGMLNKKSEFLEQKIAEELKRAKEYGTKNKRGKKICVDLGWISLLEHAAQSGCRQGTANITQKHHSSSPSPLFPLPILLLPSSLSSSSSPPPLLPILLPSPLPLSSSLSPSYLLSFSSCPSAPEAQEAS